MAEHVGEAGRAAASPAIQRRGRGAPLRVAGLVLFAVALGARGLLAHETLDIDAANTLVAAAERAATRTKAAEPAARAASQFALGKVLLEATEALNRNLAAHNGQLTVNAELMLQALAQRGLAPPFDQAIGRYRLPRTALEDAVRLAPDAAFALQARFELLKAGFYESFVLDPFQLVGIGLNDLEREIAEAAALGSRLLDPDMAEETAFIHAMNLARAARLAPNPEPRRVYAQAARTALGAFAEAYPESMRAAAAGMILKGLGGTQ